MKKSLVALAALAVAGAASAQSSVTLFGVVDASISHYTVKSGWYNNSGFLVVPPTTAPIGVKKSQTALANSGYNSSRLGFRGTEDLGGGLAASFWLEASIGNDSGTPGVTAFNRRSTVSLSGGFGEVRLGRDYTPTFWNDTVFDPFGTNGVGTNLISTINGNVAIARGPGGLAASDTYVRTSNSIGYFLPPNLGGFYGQLQYALHENVKSSDLAGSPSKRGRYVGGRFGYANGPLDVAASYGESTAADVTGVFAGTGVGNGVNFDNKIKSANLGASYDFGVVKLFGEVSRVTDSAEFTSPILALGSFTTTDKDKYTGALIGVTVPVGAGLIRAAYSRVKFKNDQGSTFSSLFGTTTDLDTSANKFAIGYVHNLSKRTALYATASRIRIKNGENNPAIMGATTGGSPTFLQSTAVVGGVTVPATFGYSPRTATGYDFGIRHAF